MCMFKLLGESVSKVKHDNKEYHHYRGLLHRREACCERFVGRYMEIDGLQLFYLYGYLHREIEDGPASNQSRTAGGYARHGYYINKDDKTYTFVKNVMVKWVDKENYWKRGRSCWWTLE